MNLLVENKHDKVCLNISLFVFGQMVCQIIDNLLLSCSGMYPNVIYYHSLSL